MFLGICNILQGEGLGKHNDFTLTCFNCIQSSMKISECAIFTENIRLFSDVVRNFPTHEIFHEIHENSKLFICRAIQRILQVFMPFMLSVV